MMGKKAVPLQQRIDACGDDGQQIADGRNAPSTLPKNGESAIGGCLPEARSPRRRPAGGGIFFQNIRIFLHDLFDDVICFFTFV